MTKPKYMKRREKLVKETEGTNTHTWVGRRGGEEGSNLYHGGKKRGGLAESEVGDRVWGVSTVVAWAKHQGAGRYSPKTKKLPKNDSRKNHMGVKETKNPRKNASPTEQL